MRAQLSSNLIYRGLVNDISKRYLHTVFLLGKEEEITS